MNNEQKDDGGPAFPNTISRTQRQPRASISDSQAFIASEGGMSVRDYFAASVDVPWNAALESLSIKYPERDGKFTLDEVAAFRATVRFREADAMLEARKRNV